MKNKLIFAFIALCFASHALGQKTSSIKKIDMHATYFYDEELPKFVGTWVWQSGSDRFEIEIIACIDFQRNRSFDLQIPDKNSINRTVI